MATATTNSSVPCVITYGPSLDSTGTGIEWVEITNTQTGGKRTLDLKSQNLDPRRFRNDYADMWRIITNTDNGATISLTNEQRNCFARMCKERRDATTTVVRNAVVDTKPSAASDASSVNHINRLAIQQISREMIRKGDNTLDAAKAKWDMLSAMSQDLSSVDFYTVQVDISKIAADVNGCVLNYRIIDRYLARMRNLSGFAGRKEDIEQPELQEHFREIQDLGAVITILDLHPRMNDRVRRWCLESMNELVVKHHADLLTAIDAAAVKYHATLAEIDAESESVNKAQEEDAARSVTGSAVPSDKAKHKADMVRISAIRTAITLAGERLNNAIRIAEQFDAMNVFDDLLNAQREAIASQAEAFNAEIALRPGRKLKPAPKPKRIRR